MAPGITLIYFSSFLNGLVTFHAFNHRVTNIFTLLYVLKIAIGLRHEWHSLVFHTFDPFCHLALGAAAPKMRNIGFSNQQQTTNNWINVKLTATKPGGGDR